jgi:hypothetical protein
MKKIKFLFVLVATVFCFNNWSYATDQLSVEDIIQFLETDENYQRESSFQVQEIDFEKHKTSRFLSIYFLDIYGIDDKYDYIKGLNNYYEPPYRYTIGQITKKIIFDVINIGFPRNPIDNEYYVPPNWKNVYIEVIEEMVKQKTKKFNEQFNKADIRRVIYATINEWKCEMKNKFKFFRVRGVTNKIANEWPYNKCFFAVTIEYRVYDPELDNT